MFNFQLAQKNIKNSEKLMHRKERFAPSKVPLFFFRAIL